MQLSLQNFSSLVENAAAAVQGAASSLIDLTVGSVLRAILEANAALALWMQWLIVQTLATTRLATSSGVDCDSFGGDFGFSRLPAVAATGAVTFSRFTATLAAVVPVGTKVSTIGNTQSYVVVADTTNAAYSAAVGGYSLAAGLNSVNATVAASAPGSAGNVLAGAISLLSSAIAGIDTVTNANPTAGGMDAESDTSFKARFGNYLASLSKATDTAIGVAVTAVRQGLSYTISENINQTGQTQMGMFVVTVDDGSGSPQASLLASVQAAVNNVRPVGTNVAVQGPVVMLVNVTVVLTSAIGASHMAAVAAAALAVQTYITALPVGATLSYTRLAQVIYDSTGTITAITELLLNGGSADVVPGAFGAVRAGVIAVS